MFHKNPIIEIITDNRNKYKIILFLFSNKKKTPTMPVIGINSNKVLCECNCENPKEIQSHTKRNNTPLRIGVIFLIFDKQIIKKMKVVINITLSPQPNVKVNKL